ncbi:hypothetical protein BT69DRAFT_729413 [Atractiella rhizophila]|nr:hypothetical protein BT69DRAFT_729413 [Atractiella rhizophila]
MNERGVVYSKTWWIITILFWINLGDTVNKYILFIQQMDTTRTGPLTFSGPTFSATVPVATFQGILTIFIQAIYIHRIVRLTKGMSRFNSLHRLARIITYSCLCLAGCLMVVSIGGFVAFSRISSRPIPEWFPDLTLPGILALASASSVDVILCSCMVYHLHQHKSQSDFQQTSTTASRYIKLTVETGLLPTIGQIVDLVLIIVEPKTGIWAGFGYLVAKLYVVAVLVLYEAALSGAHGTSSNDRNKQSSGDLSGRRFHGQVLVTETFARREDVVEQPVQLQNIPQPSLRFELEKKAQSTESVEA